jgi:multicomponent Na+:H+ antiporter subunit D
MAVFYSMGLHAGAQRACPDPVQRLLRPGDVRCHRRGLSDNLFTLYLFYEIVSVCTYPLVAHHQDEEGYEGAKKYIVYLTTTAKGFSCCRP